MKDAQLINRQTLIGSLLGCIAGLLLGNYATNLSFIGDVFTNLLIVVVFPYLICSLLYSLGRLSPKLAKKLFRHAILIFLLLASSVFLALWIIGFIFPSPTELLLIAPTKDTHLVQQLIDMLVPANLIKDILSNYLPAIIVFCVFFGLVLQRVDNKEPLMSVLQSLVKACLHFWEVVVNFTPIAAFAFFANIFGTMSMSQLQYTSLYLLVVTIACVLLSCWLLPFIVAKLTGVSGKRLIDDTKQAIIISVLTGMIATIIPLLIKSCEQLIKDQGFFDEKSEDLIDVSATIAFPFLELGNYITYLFILFSAFYYGVDIPLLKQILLPFLSMVSFVGTGGATFVSYKMLASWLHLPDNSNFLLVELTAITRHLVNILSVAGLYSFAVLTLHAYYQKLKWRNPALLFHLLFFYGFLSVIVYCLTLNTTYAFWLLIATCGVVLALILSRRVLPFITRRRIGALFLSLSIFLVGLFALINQLPNPTSTNKFDLLSRDSTYPLSIDPQGRAPTANKEALKVILESRTLYFGFDENNPPYSYFNDKQQLVGLAIAYAELLAQKLNVTLKLVPYSKENMVDKIRTGQIDIAYSAEVLGSAASAQMLFSKPSHFSFLSFVTKPQNKQDFAKLIITLRKQSYRLGVVTSSYHHHLLNGYLSASNVVNYPSFKAAEDALRRDEIKALVIPIDNAMAFVNQYKGFVTVVPKGIKIELPVAFAMAKDSFMFRQLINHWQGILVHLGLSKELYNYWVMAGGFRAPPARWNVIDWLLKKTSSSKPQADLR